jgi:hypothetical protein
MFPGGGALVGGFIGAVIGLFVSWGADKATNKFF